MANFGMAGRKVKDIRNYWLTGLSSKKARARTLGVPLNHKHNDRLTPVEIPTVQFFNFV